MNEAWKKEFSVDLYKQYNEIETYKKPYKKGNYIIIEISGNGSEINLGPEPRKYFVGKIAANVNQVLKEQVVTYLVSKLVTPKKEAEEKYVIDEGNSIWFWRESAPTMYSITGSTIYGPGQGIEIKKDSVDLKDDSPTNTNTLKYSDSRTKENTKDLVTYHKFKDDTEYSFWLENLDNLE